MKFEMSREYEPASSTSKSIQCVTFALSVIINLVGPAPPDGTDHETFKFPTPYVIERVVKNPLELGAKAKPPVVLDQRLPPKPNDTKVTSDVVLFPAAI